MADYTLTTKNTYSTSKSYSPRHQSSVPNRQQVEAKLFWKVVEFKKSITKDYLRLEERVITLIFEIICR